MIDNGWVALGIENGQPGIFEKTLSILKEDLPVLDYARSIKRFKIPIYDLDLLLDLAYEYDWDVCGSKRLVRYSKYWKRKNRKRKKAKKNFDFSTKYWVDDKDLQILPYQAAGINFCLIGNGAMIADDMGVGKTLQAMGVMCRVLERDNNANILIVVKSALKEQWREEILKFTTLDDDLVSIVGGREYYKCPEGLIEDGAVNFSNTCRHCDNKEKCKRIVGDSKKLRKNQIENGSIIIISYECFRINEKDLKRKELDLIIFDEASKIKTFTAQVSKAALVVCEEHSTAIKIVMSGTFIENRLDELYVPLTIVDQRVVGNYKGFLDRYTERDFFGTVIGHKRLPELKRKLKPFLIRRTLDQVWAERPEIKEKVRICEMFPFQRKIYNDARDGVLKELEDMIFAEKINYSGVLALLIYLLQLACTVESLEEPKKGQKASTKIETLKGILKEEIGQDKQVIVFCSFPNKIAPYIETALVKDDNRVCTVSGNDKTVVIRKKVKKFKKGKYNVLLCSDVLAYGYNLQFCNYLINFNLPWNPALLDQRIGRVYRKGQKKNVVVTNLVTAKTIDERVLDKLNEKRKLFEDMLGYGKFKNLKKPKIKELLEMIK